MNQLIKPLFIVLSIPSFYLFLPTLKELYRTCFADYEQQEKLLLQQYALNEESCGAAITRKIFFNRLKSKIAPAASPILEHLCLCQGYKAIRLTDPQDLILTSFGLKKDMQEFLKRKYNIQEINTNQDKILYVNQKNYRNALLLALTQRDFAIDNDYLTGLLLNYNDDDIRFYLMRKKFTKDHDEIFSKNPDLYYSSWPQDLQQKFALYEQDPSNQSIYLTAKEKAFAWLAQYEKMSNNELQQKLET